MLIVDDDPTQLMSMTKILSPHYQVIAAISGKKALQIVSEQPLPDIILLDVMMPKMSGDMVLQQLKSNETTQDIPVIFVSAMESEQNEQDGLALGAADYITKPVKPAILLARVKTHLQLKQAHDVLQNQNELLESEVAKRLQENFTVQNATIFALAHLAEIRDPETGDHILRTQAYVNCLAVQLQKDTRYVNILSNSYIDTLTRSAPLHDIGKVGIPDHILLKAGKLTSTEWQIMKTHAQLGAQAIELAENDVAQSLEFLTLAKEIAHHHHEKYDGSGYPDKLIGDQIPLSARIMAIADVFDALINKRVYKQAFAHEQAFDIITQESGKHFDPVLVTAFRQCYPEFIAIAQRYSTESEPSS